MGGGNYAPAKLGPWTAGMNTLSDASAIADNELVDCVNLELDFDGSLVGRPPVVPAAGAIPWTGNILLLGYFTFATGVYLLGSNSSGTFYKLGSGAWILISANLKSTSAVQYGGFVFILATNGSAAPSGKWNPSAGFTAVTGMPKGQTIAIYKDRGFIAAGESAPANSSRLYFSKVTDLTDWTSATLTGQIDVNPGDGQDLVDIIAYNNTIMCFKQNSTYVFAYSITPGDGALRLLSNTIGVLTHHCVVSFENNLYLYHSTGRVYEVVKNNFGLLNPKVEFVFDATSPGTFTMPVFVTVHGTRLLVRFYHRVYSFGLRTRTWGRWETEEYFGPFVMEPVNNTANANPRYFSGSCVNSITSVYQCNDGFDELQQESMTCSITTKTYDMSHQIRVGRYFLTQSEKIKRMFWWGAQVLTAKTVTGIATPLIHNPQVSWGTLVNTQWGDLNTWEFPLSSPAQISRQTALPDSQFSRFVKFPRSLRFRQIKYQIILDTIGTQSDGPVRVFQLTALIGSKAYQSETVG